ncbi:alpha-2-macroglobulin family protein [Roseovarius faecimaris]|uniref:Alpha-2-macroglobulin family protein n=1 Tax=Roseovarius faecimaris TaxID=2494550 RepID=A0A6I6IX64_9RHOB|nr:alpha-2-macroglobulin family protein [Roseovarius faecimaris]QGY00018.1 alpha-2-macroglobulin family protein [Roseovarius faecimaris]
MLRHLISVLFIATFAAPLAAQSTAEAPVPDRRQIVTQDVDFYGSDLQALFDTTRQACRTACFSNPACKAYTFNTKSNACFPKSEISDRVPFEGAISAQMIDTDAGVLARASQRREDLSFLSGRDISQARALANDIGSRHPGGQYDVPFMLNAAQERIAQNDYLNAMRWTGAVVAATDAPDQWAEYARLSSLIQTNDSSKKRRYQAQAFEGAVNAYLRANADPIRINALMLMADALEDNRRGRDMIRALRLAETIQPRQDIIAELDSAIAKYGFRITEHRADNETASPRLCAEFSEPLVRSGVDYTPFVKLPDAGMVVQATGNQICVDGAQHGQRYTVTFREGLPAASGEALIKDVEISLYIRDRSPSVNFPGRAFVLPKTDDAALPIETVNLDEVELTLRRVSDRNLLRAIQEDYFGRPLGEYDLYGFRDNVAEDVWTGVGEVGNELNQTMTTRLPMGEALAGQDPGMFALTASIDGVPLYEDPGATQWFVLTDLGLTSLKGNDGLHMMVRGLSDAAAEEGVKLTLLSRSNRELGEAMTDAEGHALFAPGLTRGSGGAAPALVIAEAANGDTAFLNLTDPAFDLSDRGVEGREPAPPVDVFLATDRGAYRAGEVIHATVLARDEVADAIPGLPMTAILKRPDGVEYSRIVSTEDAAGGHVFTLPIGATAPRGTWTLDIKADVDAPALATRQLLVEDFLPERIDFDLSLPEGQIRPGDVTDLTISARYLFGAPGAGLKAGGTAKLRALRTLEAFPGYRFGQHDVRAPSPTAYLDSGETDATGTLILPVELPQAEVADRPYEVRMTISVQEGSGRPVERNLTRMLAPAGPMIGIKPGFDDVVPEGDEATFQVIGIGPDLSPAPMQVRWTLNRVSTRYQWYQQYGSWNWEPITTRKQIATGEGALGDGPLSVTAPVEWGQYELLVERSDGVYVAASYSFYAGWYAPSDASSTPDTLELSLDRPDYTQGDTATLRIVPRYDGVAMVTVMSNRVIARQAVDVSAGENLIPLSVTEDWGAGAYVTAQVIRPMDVSAGQNPARALGLAYARIDPGEKQLSVRIDAPELSNPRGPLPATVTVEGLGAGDTGYVTLAAVDLGILNLTGFESPDPSGHYFGQRRLGVEIRDVYGRLIDGLNGAQGQIRSGGDAGGGMQRQSPPPTEELVAYFSGPVTVGADGTAEIAFDIPDFNGTVRLMAVAWSGKAVGQAERDVIVRDPVVVTATLPRFLAPGDTSQLLLEIIHADGPSGRMGLDVSANGLTLVGGAPSGIDMTDGQKVVLRLPVTAGEVGDHSLRVALTTPDGKLLTKGLTLGVRSNDPTTSITRRLSLAAGDTFTLDDNVFAGLRGGEGVAVVSAGPLSKLNAPRLLSALDRYPYGCTEQITSRAMPLLYFNQVAQALGLGDADKVQERIDQAIAQVLTRQSSNGAFGLWRASSGDFWLDAYVADFLSRAKSKGHDVPQLAFSMAMDNLRNRVNYAPDFDKGGEDIAYALLVLAREGAASMGDLRYYADVKGSAFATPIASAQLGAALAAYGDPTRADRMFAQAMRQIAVIQGAEQQFWRADYGTRLRDRAAVLALAVEAGSNAINADALAGTLTNTGPYMSTQESAWTLMATAALIDNPAIGGLTLNGQTVSGPFVRKFDAQGLSPQAITNTGSGATDITLTTIGVPDVPEPAGGYGYALSRAYYDLDGNTVSLDSVASGTRLVVVLTVSPFESGEARLMVDDPLPAGLEIDNPNLLRTGDVRSLDWLKPATPEHQEFRSDRFLAAVDWRSDKPFQLAYMVRAIAPGSYHHPAAIVEDMYRPQYRAWTDTGAMQVTE